MAKRWVRWGVRSLLIGCVVGTLALVFGSATLAGLYQHHVVNNPGEHMSPDAVRAVIRQESPVYYRDGVTRLGVFFDSEHRDYVPYRALPKDYVSALVAAEDTSYWRHAGVSVRGIMRAMRDNVLAGRVVAGGSTLTQQTAKNLFYRPDRSFRSKWVELVNALRLEVHFSKEEILEFYVNQFHVSGNGRGVGIAAVHFFDKDVSELDLVQHAFLAGLVKAPAYYDPFLGDEARRERAIERAQNRTRYVLQRIVDAEASDLAGRVASHEELTRVRALQEEARGLLRDGFELDFRRGTFRYESSAVLDEVARRLKAPPFARVLAEAGVRDPAVAGLKVITTLDADLQREASYGLWHHLTELGLALEPDVPLTLPSGPAPRFDPDRPPVAHTLRVGVLGEQDPERGGRVVDLGGSDCILDGQATQRLATARRQGDRGTWSVRARTSDLEKVAEMLPAGARVRVSVRSVDEEAGALCDLEVTPQIQGASLVVDQGTIRSMVTGNDNRGFNRARALRQLGSTWKPLMYHAAIKLGWSPTDLLDNRRAVFPFSTTFYYPRPDHEPDAFTTMAWAGVRSENIGSIWLLYHLLDRLDGDEVRSLAASLGMLRASDEEPEAYRLRIQKSGVLPTRARLAEAWYLQARSEVLSGLSDELPEEERIALQSLLYGWGFDREREVVARKSSRERASADRALDSNWREVSSRLEGCAERYASLTEPTPELEGTPDGAGAGLYLRDGPQGVEVSCVPMDQGFVEASEWLSLNPTSEERAYAPIDRMWVGDYLPYGPLRQIQDGVARRRLADELRSAPVDLYSPEVLLWHQDMRVLLALRYVEALAERYGVQRELPDVLSLPLGAADLTLLEACSLYEGLLTGHAWDASARTLRGKTVLPAAGPMLIMEIRDARDRVLYKAEPERRVVSPSAIGEQTADILHNVVEWGTGRRAKGQIRSVEGLLPVGGKTGTTNAYRNAAFLGYVPEVDERGRAWMGRGPAVGVYVGYDDNREMKRGGLRVAGARGALPAWTAVAKAVAGGGESVQGDGVETVELYHAPGLTRVSLTSDGETVAARDGEPQMLIARSSMVAADLGGLPASPDAKATSPEETEDTEADVLVDRWLRGDHGGP